MKIFDYKLNNGIIGGRLSRNSQFDHFLGIIQRDSNKLLVNFSDALRLLAVLDLSELSGRFL